MSPVVCFVLNGKLSSSDRLSATEMKACLSARQFYYSLVLSQFILLHIGWQIVIDFSFNCMHMPCLHLP